MAKQKHRTSSVVHFHVTVVYMYIYINKSSSATSIAILEMRLQITLSTQFKQGKIYFLSYNNNNSNNNMVYTLVSGKKYFQSKVLHIIDIFIYKQ